MQLNEHAQIIEKKIKNKHVRETVKKNAILVRTTLMQGDLEFEYPQKLEKLLVRSDILRLLDEEEDKLKQMAKRLHDERVAAERGAASRTPGDIDYLTIDHYYGNKEESSNHDKAYSAFGSQGLGASGKISFEEFVKQTASENIFDNEVSIN